MQFQTGTLYGTVEDPQGRGLPGATVTLTGEGRVQVTEAEGQFRFPDLAPGGYTAKAELEGFATATEPATIQMGRSTGILITLKPAVIGEIAPAS